LRLQEVELRSNPKVSFREPSFGETEGLPDQEEGVFLIVSAIAAQGCKERDDVFVPARPIRDEQGRIVACQALARIK